MSLNTEHTNDPLAFLNIVLVDVAMGTATTYSMPTICKDSDGYYVRGHTLSYNAKYGTLLCTRRTNLNSKPLAYAGAAWVLEQELEKPQWQDLPERLDQATAEAQLTLYGVTMMGEPLLPAEGEDNVKH